MELKRAIKYLGGTIYFSRLTSMLNLMHFFNNLEIACRKKNGYFEKYFKFKFIVFLQEKYMDNINFFFLNQYELLFEEKSYLISYQTVHLKLFY